MYKKFWVELSIRVRVRVTLRLAVYRQGMSARKADNLTAICEPTV
jgi:hypothetical protein